MLCNGLQQAGELRQCLRPLAAQMEIGDKEDGCGNDSLLWPGDCAWRVIPGYRECLAGPVAQREKAVIMRDVTCCRARGDALIMPAASWRGKPLNNPCGARW